MTITKTVDVEGTLQQIYALAAAGCDIVRCTCNEQEAAEGLAQIVPRSPIPVIADIHHQYKMALAAIEAGVHGLRLNPGNIRRPEHIKAVATEARDRGLDSRAAVAKGISVTAGTITSAASIMVVVFAVFVGLKFVFIQQLGLGLAVAVFIDATLIRSVLLPATMTLLGDWNWWMPRFLDWIPRVTIEGGPDDEEPSEAPGTGAAVEEPKVTAPA